MPAKLYVIPGSHPSETAAAALRIKGIEFERVNRLPVISRLQQRALFETARVPALRLDGEKITGSRQILRRLEELRPDPPLYPSEPERRRRVEEAESWGEEVLQQVVRRVAWAALKRRPKAMRSYTEGADLPVPVGLAMAGAGPTARIAGALNKAGEEKVRADLAALPGHLDRIDEWIAEGVLGGEQPNAADLQIGSSIALLLTFGDVRPLLQGRPCAELARRWFADFKGETPAGTLPAGWVPQR
jgi:glutathione S-transferase